MNKFLWVLIFVVMFSGFGKIMAQLNSGGIPVSFKLKNLNPHFQEISISPPEVKQLVEEDLIGSKNAEPHRFAVLLPLNINLENAGTWDSLTDGALIWRVKLMSSGALALNLYFDHFNIPQGAKLFIYDEDRNQVKGAFTSANNHSSHLFATELLNGDNLIIEYYQPEYAEQNGIISISELGYAYRSIPFSDENIDGFGSSDFCEINVNCPTEGDDWHNQNNGAARILIKVGGSSYWCSGSLVNNVRNDHTPYLLTADHCAYKYGHYATPDDLNQWIFYFNYESPNCPDEEPYELYSITGATKVAQGGDRGQTGSDFYLLLLNDNVPESYLPYFNGWSVLNEGSDSGVGIHHPQGDIKKISTYLEPLISSQWNFNGLMSHWRVIWAETENNWAVTEGGSSGSPIFDSNGRIIGTLTGGQAACESSGNLGPDKPDYYGKFSYHWDLNGDVDSLMLKPWLDPDNTGTEVLNGSTVGVAEKSSVEKDAIRLFPNPATDYIIINFITFDADEIEISLVDILGKPIENYFLNKKTEQFSLDISGLPAGIYYIKVNYGHCLIVKKIIKQ